MHWFKIGWIDRAVGYIGEQKARELQKKDQEVKNLLYLHFEMDDNLSLDEEIKARYRSMYAGVFFYDILRAYGQWQKALYTPCSLRPIFTVMSFDQRDWSI